MSISFPENAMIPLVPRLGILQRLFAIKINNSVGSSFAYPLGGVFCFITAKHVISSLTPKEETNISVFKNSKWEDIKATPYFPEELDIDIAIIKTNIPVNGDEYVIELSAANIILGQDIYFLGFPYFDQKIK